MKNTQNNPLLNKDVVKHELDFLKIKASDFAEAFDFLIPLVKQEHEVLATTCPLIYELLFESSHQKKHLEALLHHLSALNSTVQTPELRKVYEDYIPKISSMFQDMGLDERIYNKIVSFTQTQEYTGLDDLHKKLLNKVILNYKLQGITLPSEEKKKLIEITEKLEVLQNNFGNNIKDRQASLSQKLSLNELKGLPERALDNLKKIEEKNASGEQLYEVKYASGLYGDIMTYCEVEETRKKIYEDMLTVGTMEGLDNKKIIPEIVELLQQNANILGFETMAHLNLVNNMVKEPQEALDFIENLAHQSHPKAKKETQDVNAFSQSLLGRIPNFWDKGFVIEKMKKSIFSIDSEEIRKYFPVKKVVSGLFEIVEALYGIRFEKTSRSVWHTDVMSYALFDNSSNGKIGEIYIDLYKREYKSNGAWMNPTISRHKNKEGLRLPIAYVVCNIAKDVKQEPTMDFDEITTWFHEMGHALHHLLTKVDEEFFSGIHVEHDAVELPSMFMENFAWDYEVLKKLSSHIDTQEQFPVNLYEKLKSSKYFLAGSMMLGQAIYSQLDMMIYANRNSKPLELEKEVYNRWKTRELDSRAGILPTFSHIFAGGYGAGYYAYKWAEVLSTDSFAALKECGDTYMEQREAANAFRKHILESGGANDMSVNFKAFRGRAPDIKYLMEDYAIETT